VVGSPAVGLADAHPGGRCTVLRYSRRTGGPARERSAITGGRSCVPNDLEGGGESPADGRSARGSALQGFVSSPGRRKTMYASPVCTGEAGETKASTAR